MAFIAAVVLAGTAIVGGGGYIFKRVIDRAEDAVEGVAGDLKEFVIKNIWPNILPILRIILTFVGHHNFVLWCISEDGPWAISEILLVNGVYGA